MRFRPWLLVLVAVGVAGIAVVVLLVNRDSGDEAVLPSPESQIRHTMARWDAAGRAGDGEAACALLTPNTVEVMERPGGESCEVRNGHKTCCGRPLKVEDVVVTDSQAIVTALHYDDEGDSAPMEIVVRRVGGEWKIDVPKTVDRIQFPRNFG
jgi:hypothetical protein